MADINRVNFDYIKRWEGGLSKDPKDQAAKDPVPDGSGYHTNMGVTWTTFKGMAKTLGYTPTPKLFYAMPKNIWLGIYKSGYWNAVKGDEINSQAIAELCADWVWGSGGYAISLIQKVLNQLGTKPALPGSYVFGPLTLKAMNDAIKKRGEKVVFEALFNARKKFLETLGSRPAYSSFKAGWLNRMQDFYTYASNIVTDNPVTSSLLVGVVVVALIWGLSNGNLKKLGLDKKTAARVAVVSAA